MKNLFRMIGIIAIAAVIGLSIASCKEEEKEEIYDPVGTWEISTDGGTVTFEIKADGTFSATMGGQTVMSGTYTQDGNTLTLKNSSGTIISNATLTSKTTMTLVNTDASGAAGTYSATKV